MKRTSNTRAIKNKTAGQWKIQPKLSSLFICILASLSASAIAAGNDAEFEELFLRKDKNGASPSVFLYKNAITPGLKTIDIVVNDRLVDRFEVNFVEDNEKRIVLPCLNQNLLNAAGVKTEIYNDWLTELKAKDGKAEPNAVCENLRERIPASNLYYDDAKQTLRLTLPQEAVNSERFQMISPKEWDDGTPSLRTAYNGYVYSSRQKNSGPDNDKTTTDSSYVSLNSVATAGPWRLYSFDTFNKESGKGWETNHDRLYVERNIVALRSKVTAGDIYTYTPSSIMGVIPLRGITLSTNERMMLESQFTYAPVIRGTARTNARLTVRQRGNIIYSKTLTPGNFAIDDIYSGQVGADLDVTVEETDGTVQNFKVPYTALPNMIRPGAMRYSASFGEYRDDSLSSNPMVGAFSLERGFEAFTLNGSALGSDKYQSLAMGVAWNAGDIGAFSLDLAQARYKQSWDLPNDGEETRNGSAVRLLYAKQFDTSDTGLRILGYQYRSERFLEFSEFISRSGYDGSDPFEQGDSLWNKRRRSRIEVNVNQGMNEYGNLFVTFSQDRYYGTSEKSTSASAGYGMQIGKASASLMYTYNKNGGDSYDNQIGLSVSMPLSWGEQDRHRGSLNYNLTRNKDNQYNQSMGFAGSLPDNTLSYSANVQRDHRGDFSESASLGYNASYANMNTSISHSKYSDQLSFGAAGGVVLYKGGVVLSQQLGDTIAIIETPDAPGIRVASNSNVKTDLWGRAVVTYLSPYRYNTISLDVKDTEGVELKESARKVVPTEGAAVLLKFVTRVGRRAIVIIKSDRDIPVGAYVTVQDQTEEAGIVGNNGIAYLTGLDARKDEVLTVSWGSDDSQQCRFTLPRLPEDAKDAQAEQWHKKVTVNCK
ncbi:fimbria/pilus outer membrane usher protein [Leminorella grimontii]|uniref:fimbria/pilus outer membrane usher protein n=1 Tax=Leminorella grimontii TaxID=82981 RepID=UPI0032205191